MPETAMAEQETIAGQAETTALDDTAPSETVETAGDQPAETTPAETVETEARPDLNLLLNGLPDEDFDKLERVFRTKQSVKDTTAAETKKATEEQIRREAGRSENVRAIVAQALERGDETTEEQAAFALSLNQSYAASEVLTSLGRSALARYGADEATKQALAQHLQESPLVGDMLERTDRLFSTAVDAAAKQQIAELDLKDVPESSKLHKSIEAEVQRRTVAEFKAREAEAAKAKAPAALPNTPAGNSGGGSSGPTPAEYNNASPAQRREWKDKGVEVVIS